MPVVGIEPAFVGRSLWGEDKSTAYDKSLMRGDEWWNRELEVGITTMRGFYQQYRWNEDGLTNGRVKFARWKWRDRYEWLREGRKKRWTIRLAKKFTSNKKILKEMKRLSKWWNVKLIWVEDDINEDKTIVRELELVPWRSASNEQEKERWEHS